MGIEIERKFLVLDDGWREHAEGGVVMRQAYIVAGAGCSVRVRLLPDRALLTLKGRTDGFRRSEFEYAIPLEEAELIFRDLSVGAPIEKTRYTVQVNGFDWEVDEFAGQNRGLVVAEIEGNDETELERAISQRPSWLGEEVSHDRRYTNAQLALHPFRTWCGVK
jgi:adenylate cyclase